MLPNILHQHKVIQLLLLRLRHLPTHLLIILILIFLILLHLHLLHPHQFIPLLNQSQVQTHSYYPAIKSLVNLLPFFDFIAQFLYFGEYWLSPCDVEQVDFYFQTQFNL